MKSHQIFVYLYPILGKIIRKDNIVTKNMCKYNEKSSNLRIFVPDFRKDYKKR